MDKIRELQKASGTGLKHSGRVGSLINPPVASSNANNILEWSVLTLEEPGSYHVSVDSATKVPATLKCGELTAYTPDEAAKTKGTEFSSGRCVHVYRGYVRRGTNIRDGGGSFHYGSGEVFEGRWRNGLRHGLGGLYLPSGYSFEGHFKDDEPCGKGVEVFPNGEAYIGDFQHGKPWGKGVMYYEDLGSCYEGSWVEGERHGGGQMYYANGDIYEGNWEKGLRHGRGLMTTVETLQLSAARYQNRVVDSLLEESIRSPTSTKLDGMGHVPTGTRTVRRQMTYACQWVKGEISGPMKAVDGHVPAIRQSGPRSTAIVSPLGVDLRSLRVVPNLWTEVHPAHFQRIKQSFEKIDQNATGEIEMEELRAQWDMVNNVEVFEILEKAATTVGQDNTLELIEVFAGLYPHLPQTELRRWVLTDLTLEYIQRLRGVLAEVPAAKQDGFYTLSAGRKELRKIDVEVCKGSLVGGVRVSHAMFLRNRILFGGDTLTFPQMLGQVFPNVWKEALLRVEVEDVPVYALDGYLAAFAALLDDDNPLTGLWHLPLESMKVAQRRYQAAIAQGHDRISMPTSRLEELVQAGVMRHQPRWVMGDITITVNGAKSMDRGKSGFVSFVEIMRTAFPNVPCLVTKERLMASAGGPAGAGVGVGAGAAAAGGTVANSNVTVDSCKCCFCKFVASRIELKRPKPSSPYGDGILAW